MTEIMFFFVVLDDWKFFKQVILVSIRKYLLLTDIQQELIDQWVDLELLLGDNSRSTRFSISKNNPNSNSATNWTLVSLNNKEEDYRRKLVYDELDTALADMCFSNTTKLHSV